MTRSGACTRKVRTIADLSATILMTSLAPATSVSCVTPARPLRRALLTARFPLLRRVAFEILVHQHAEYVFQAGIRAETVPGHRANAVELLHELCARGEVKYRAAFELRGWHLGRGR